MAISAGKYAAYLGAVRGAAVLVLQASVDALAIEDYTRRMKIMTETVSSDRFYLSARP
jgi:hypothetical protein